MATYYNNFYLELKDLCPAALDWLRASHNDLIELQNLLEDKAGLDESEREYAAALWSANLHDQEINYATADVINIPALEIQGSTAVFFMDSDDVPGIDIICSWIAKFLGGRPESWMLPEEVFLEWANWCDHMEAEGFSGGAAIITKDGYSCTYTGASQVQSLLREMHARREVVS